MLPTFNEMGDLVLMEHWTAFSNEVQVGENVLNDLNQTSLLHLVGAGLLQSNPCLEVDCNHLLES